MSNPPNKWAVKATDITEGMTIWVDTEEFNVIGTPRIKGNAFIIPCFNVTLGCNEDIPVNLQQQREIYTAKLVSSYRKG